MQNICIFIKKIDGCTNQTKIGHDKKHVKKQKHWNFYMIVCSVSLLLSLNGNSEIAQQI